MTPSKLRLVAVSLQLLARLALPVIVIQDGHEVHHHALANQPLHALVQVDHRIGAEQPLERTSFLSLGQELLGRIVHGGLQQLFHPVLERWEANNKTSALRATFFAPAFAACSVGTASAVQKFSARLRTSLKKLSYLAIS